METVEGLTELKNYVETDEKTCKELNKQIGPDSISYQDFCEQ